MQGYPLWLLDYCAFHADRSTTDAIKDVLVRFYTPEEINSAKNELYDECFDVLGVAPVHRDTAARGAHVIAAKEIVEGMRKVDASEVKVRPQFAAIKLDRLPHGRVQEDRHDVGGIPRSNSCQLRHGN